MISTLESAHKVDVVGSLVGLYFFILEEGLEESGDTELVEDAGVFELRVVLPQVLVLEGVHGKFYYWQLLGYVSK